jgi:hypothetical protein
MAALHTTSSPDWSRPNNAVAVAAMPEDVSSADSAPSSAATFISTACTVGFA